MYDVIIIGGGTSGLMASVSAAQYGARVLLLEKNTDLGKKLLLTGGGRCNVTNNRPAEDIVSHIPGNGKFLYSAFSHFDNSDIINFFEQNGVPLKEEDHGRMFPTTNKARTIVDTFIRLIKGNNVTIHTKTTVKSLTYKNGNFIVKTDNLTSYETLAVIIATGGKSVPRTGSTGDGYAFASKFGHTITPLFPTESPLTSDAPFIISKRLQGISLRDVALSVLNTKGKPITTHQMDMIFTHFGLSGPAALRCSSFIYHEQLKQKQKHISMQLDVLPQKSAEDLLQFFEQKRLDSPKKEMRTILKELIPERLALLFLDMCQLTENVSLNHIDTSMLMRLITLLKHWNFNVNGTLPLDKSFVTGGGICLKEVNPKTMMSKLVPGLFFCGEILDIHGYTGGYNITSAFVTGFTAGQQAALIKQF